MTQAVPAKTSFYCKKCLRSVGPIWVKSCPNNECRGFNTIVAGAPPANAQANHDERPQLLSEVRIDALDRISTGTREFDRVLGGGLVIGSTVLLSGDPGIGKSTLLLQTANDLSTAAVINKVTGAPEDPLVVLYVSAEETKAQVASRAARLSRESGKLHLFYQSNVHEIDKWITEIDPDVLIIDSIQTMMRPDIDARPGSITQVLASAEYLIGICKARDIGCFMVAQITKDGNIAGPKAMEHLVDATLEFHKEGEGEFRNISAAKNRFGDTNETALFRMTKDGLESVENPSELLLAQHKDGMAGSCVGITLNGHRGVGVEVQSRLTSIIPINFEYELEALQDKVDAARVVAIFNALKRLQKPAKRNVTGLPPQRVNQILAVLAGIGLDIRDEVWVNVAGKLKFDDPGLDLPTALSLASFVQGMALPPKFAAFGEIGLLGEIRPVGYMDVRIKQAASMGYEYILGPVAPEYEADLGGEHDDETVSLGDALSRDDDEDDEDDDDDDNDDEGDDEESDDDDDEISDGKDRYIGVRTLEEAFKALGLDFTTRTTKQSKKLRRKNKRKNRRAAREAAE